MITRRKFRSNALCVLLQFLLALPSGGMAAQLPAEGLIFHAPFNGSLDTLAGAKTTPVSKAGEPLFVDEKMGKATRTGSKDSFLIYDGSNINAAEGTVSMW